MNRTLIALAVLLALLLPTGASAQSPRVFELEGGALKLPSAVVFETGREKIGEASKPALEHLKAYLDAKSYVTLMRIENHGDSSDKGGQALSEKRALAVAKWLVAQGVDCKRLVAVGFGDTKPAASNATPEGRAQNRRTVAVNAALRGHLIGGMPADGGGQVAGDPCAK